MKAFIRKFLLLYIGATLCVAPMALQAADKKTHHVTSGKYKNVKYKSGNRKINHRLRANKANYVDNYDGTTPLKLASAKALVINQVTGEVLYAKNTNVATPIASVTKLMTAMVMLDAHLAMDELISISDEDVDYLKGTSSRLRVGTVLTRGELLQLAVSHHGLSLRLRQPILQIFQDPR